MYRLLASAFVLASFSVAASPDPGALHFEPNVGQSASGAAFFASNGGFGIFLEPNALTFAIRAEQSERSITLQLAFSGASAQPDLVGIDRLPGVTHYLMGSDRSQWRTHVPAFGAVRYEMLYPGVDATVGTRDGEPSVDFQVSSLSNLPQINLVLNSDATLGIS